MNYYYYLLSKQTRNANYENNAFSQKGLKVLACNDELCGSKILQSLAWSSRESTASYLATYLNLKNKRTLSATHPLVSSAAYTCYTVRDLLFT